MANNLSETAFLVAVADGYELRWFTPQVGELDCELGDGRVFMTGRAVSFMSGSIALP